MAKLIALQAIPAGAYESERSAIAKGDSFEVSDTTVYDQMIADGLAEAAPAETPAPEPVKVKAVKRTKVRLLVDCAFGAVNDVVDLDPAVARTAESDGQVDTSKEAIAYALTLDQNKPKA